MITVAINTRSQIGVGRVVRDRQVTMLAALNLLVTEMFGYLNKNINNFKTPGRSGAPVPASMLVNEKGQVVKIDQSIHYKQRSEHELVGGALRECFPV